MTVRQNETSSFSSFIEALFYVLVHNQKSLSLLARKRIHDRAYKPYRKYNTEEDVTKNAMLQCMTCFANRAWKVCTEKLFIYPVKL